MAQTRNARDHAAIVRRPVVVLLSAVAALSLAVPDARAATVQATMPGFSAERVGEFPRSCGSGPTAVAVVNGTVFVAADTGLYYTTRGGLSSYKGGNQSLPWGLTVLGGALYGTTPHCGLAPATDPVDGSNCNVVRINPGTGRGRTIAAVCGYGIAADPRTSTLTVAQRDGTVVSVTEAGAVTTLFAAPGAQTLAWSEDGGRLYVGFEGGAVRVWDRSGALRPVASGVRGLAAGTSSVNLAGAVLVGVAGAVRAEPGGDVASTGREQPSALTASSNGVYAALRDELWLVRGRYSPAPPPGSPPPSTPPPTRPRIAAPVAQPTTPPVAPPQAPPPPPPPAPPVPPLATAAQIAAQPSAVANPAIVPGEQEREAALRLAATRRDPPLAPTVLWLALAGVVCLGGFTLGRFGLRYGHSRKDVLAFCEQRRR